jgi:hypothetical protein
MPSVVATPFPTRGQVLVEANFADVPGAAFICMEAVTGFGTDDELRRPLHSYVSYDSDGCLALSCGQALFWDTEISCGTPTRYCATVKNSSGTTITTAAAYLAFDTFTRTVSPGWGIASSGQTWISAGGAAADHSVTGTRGQHATVTIATDYIDHFAITNPNVELRIVGFPAAVALTGATEMQVWLRSDGTAMNGYRLLAQLATGGIVNIFLQRVVGGVITTLATTASALTYVATTQLAFSFTTWGNQLTGKIWDNTMPESTASIVTATDTTFTAAGHLNVISRRGAGNTNGTINFQWDNLTVSDVCADLPEVEVCTEDFTIECDGCFRLGDPLRPCADVRICLCADGTCGNPGGLFFAGMSTDSYADNSGNMLPVNGVYPIHVTRNRRSAAGSFTIVPTTFTDRDNLLALLSTGNILFWRGPAEYGTKDRYLAVGEVGVTPPLADLTIQPRIMDLPFVVAKAPVGPSFGVCGARVKDLCDVYPTWDALIAAGLTYADLLRGNASTTPAGLATWASINAGFASWNALAAGETDWTDVVDGD